MWILWALWFPALVAAEIALKSWRDWRRDRSVLLFHLQDRAGSVPLDELAAMSGWVPARLHGRLARLHRSRPDMRVLSDPDTGQRILTYKS